MLNVVLIEPEIPANTGNISRTCAITGARLHLVGPLGFSLDEKHLKRAGLDYWDKLDLVVYENSEEFFSKNKDAKFWFFSTKAGHTYADVTYSDGDFLVFGKETKGLPEEYVHLDNSVRIPMLPTLRSLNLSNSVAIAVYEALRQQGFKNML